LLGSLVNVLKHELLSVMKNNQHYGYQHYGHSPTSKVVNLNRWTCKHVVYRINQTFSDWI